MIIDVAGLYDDEIFADDALAAAAQPLRELAATGTRFSDVWCRSRDWPVTEYQLLAGGYPSATPFFAAAEDDPTQTLPPGAGLLQMPVAAGFIANRPAYDAWRQPTAFGGESLFDAAHALGMTTALVGQPDFHALHLGGRRRSTSPCRPTSRARRRRSAICSRSTRACWRSSRSARRAPAIATRPARSPSSARWRAPSRRSRGAAGGALVAITSRGATAIDDPLADDYGAGTSRHVPLILVGPNVRAGAVSGQPATPADLPATILFGLGAPVATDLANGTWAQGTAGRAACRSPRRAPRPRATRWCAGSTSVASP